MPGATKLITSRKAAIQAQIKERNAIAETRISKINAYTQAEWEWVANKVIEALERGETTSGALSGKNMPDRGNFFDWLERGGNEVFLARYKRAQARLADCCADDVLRLADQATDSDTAAAARVKVEARKWLASKLKPSVYGEQRDASGGNAGITITLNRYDATQQPPQVTIEANGSKEPN